MRIILLTRHYPPAISGGARRPARLAYALRQAGNDVRICAPSLPEGEPGWSVPHANRDPPISTRPRGFDLRDVARDLLLWPDPDIRWSMRAATTVIASGWKADWVLSTAPPESIHVAGRRIARAIGAMWAAEFRDSWLETPLRPQRRRWYRQLGERYLARRLLSDADLVTAVDPVVAAEATRLGGRNVHVLPHFAADASPTRIALPQDRVNIVHAGSIALSDPETDIELLLQPFEAALRANPKLLLHFVGRLTEHEQAAVSRVRPTEAVRLLGPRPLDEAMSYIAAADGLAFVGAPKMHVPPSKIVDYLQAEAPIIACGFGPWRQDPRVMDLEDPAQAMAALHRGAKRQARLPVPPNASASAQHLMSLMRAAAGD